MYIMYYKAWGSVEKVNIKTIWRYSKCFFITSSVNLTYLHDCTLCELQSSVNLLCAGVFICMTSEELHWNFIVHCAMTITGILFYSKGQRSSRCSTVYSVSVIMDEHKSHFWFLALLLMHSWWRYEVQQ